MLRQQNTIALKTGGARGIGAVIARAFCDEGADVILTDIEVVTGQSMADESDATFVRLEVTSEADWISVAERFPILDVLVNTPASPGLKGRFRARRPRLTLRTPLWPTGGPCMR